MNDAENSGTTGTSLPATSTNQHGPSSSSHLLMRPTLCPELGAAGVGRLLDHPEDHVDVESRDSAGELKGEVGCSGAGGRGRQTRGRRTRGISVGLRRRKGPGDERSRAHTIHVDIDRALKQVDGVRRSAMDRVDALVRDAEAGRGAAPSTDRAGAEKLTVPAAPPQGPAKQVKVSPWVGEAFESNSAWTTDEADFTVFGSGCCGATGPPSPRPQATVSATPSTNNWVRIVFSLMCVCANEISGAIRNTMRHRHCLTTVRRPVSANVHTTFCPRRTSKASERTGCRLLERIRLSFPVLIGSFPSELA